MATNTKESQTNAKQHGVTGALHAVQKDARPLQAFFTKFSNDWSTTLAAALAYNLLMAIFPIALAILAILGLVVGSLSQAEYSKLQVQILHTLPVSTPPGTVNSITKQLTNSSSILVIIAVVLALFNGSRLFILMEGIFGIIYHVRHRTVIKQNLMAFGMLILFILLIPIMAFASALPAVVLSILPKNTLLAFLGGILGVFIASYILFQAIYMVVPNQHISFRNSWLGALVAAIAMDIYLTLFPLYVHFVGNGPAASLGAGILLLIFFYYFAVILLLGAQVNAFFAEGVRATPVDLVTLVHITTSHLPKTEEDKEQQAAASHKDAPIGTTATKTHVDDSVANSDLKAYSAITNAAAPDPNRQEQQAPVAPAQDRHETKEEHKTKKDRPKQTTSRLWTTLEALAGTSLAFVVELVRMRRRKLQ
ncbi:MAG: YihY/virulence factor BrkB family protein [Chloroflexi bacterium]|nr:MAG: YihY/virulence factor BrkB family protein [Chloroflexota bacterium]